MIRHATRGDLPQILAIYASARQKMARSGNPNQWSEGYPPQRLLEEDIQARRLYVIQCNEEITGVFVFMAGPEPDYDTLEGVWLNDAPYQVIHRMAAREGGIAREVFAWAMERTASLRIDTHADNAPMRHVLEREGFTPVGELTLADGDKRQGYHKIRT